MTETITWYSGVALRSSKPAARVVMMSNPAPTTWTENFMTRGKTLADAIRSGQVRSAWDDYDSEADAFAGRKSTETITENKRLEEDAKRYAAEREEDRRKQEEKLRIAREMEAARKAEEAARKAEEVQSQLEALEGYGSF